MNLITTKRHEVILASAQADQAEEIESLQTLFPDEFQLIDANHFSLAVAAENTDTSILLTVQYPPHYPDEPPILSIPQYRGLNESDVDSLLTKMMEESQRYLSSPHIFMLYHFAKDFMSGSERPKLDCLDVAPTSFETSQPDQTGHSVIPSQACITEEEFLIWKAEFEAEMIQKGVWKSHQADSQRLTGKQIFLQRPAGSEEPPSDDDVSYDAHWTDPNAFGLDDME